jgi:hypothetical protein
MDAAAFEGMPHILAISLPCLSLSLSPLSPALSAQYDADTVPRQRPSWMRLATLPPRHEYCHHFPAIDLRSVQAFDQ